MRGEIMFDYINFKQYLEDNGYKQKFIAAKINLDETSLSDILRGKRKCSLENYVNICRVLNLPFGKFINQDVIN